MARVLVAGVDSSTQSCKVVVRDADTGELVRSARAHHPAGAEVDPEAWWIAFEQATAGGLLEGVAAISVAGQQHGLVLLDEDGAVVRPALLWNDTRSARAATALVDELGGAAAWAEAVGSVPVASFTVTKLRWVAEHEPHLAARAATVALPHDYLTWRVRGDARAPLTTDRGDASGTGYWSPADGRYRNDLLGLAFGRELAVPAVLPPAASAGIDPSGVVLAAGTGDNMAAALGVGAEPGDVIVSVGTSGTVFAVFDRPTADAGGAIAGFADATGAFLPLVCTMNAARVLSTTAELLGTDLDGLDELALGAAPGSDGVVVVPYFDGERTPNLPDATGSYRGLRHDNTTRHNLARAAVEGVLCGLADALDELRRAGVPSERIVLIGGGARSAAVRAIAPTVLGTQVIVPAESEHVADGAARQAAWVLAGGDGPPAWPTPGSRVVEAEPAPFVREQYAEHRIG